jgi:histidyl-tRNA synthetase
VSENYRQPVRGARDFYPEEMRLRSWLFSHFREVALRFGFEEIDAPILEHEELFTRKAGEEIVDQLYHFELHDRRLALRPEMTPSIARMVLARRKQLRFPLRWFAINQNWRYERMTRGRKREHFQWNMDIWGEEGVGAEAELIAAIFSLLERIGLGDGSVKMRVNSRALLEETLLSGVLKQRPAAFAPLCVIIDKLDKIGKEAVIEQLTSEEGLVGLSRTEAEQTVDLLEIKELEEAAARAPQGSRAVAELRELFALLEGYGVREHVVFDASIVRGLAYYTGIVFEGFDAAGSLRAVCGGGRYDRLLETLGGSATPAVGFGFGDVVIAELLTDKGLLPDCQQRVDALVFPFQAAQRTAAARLATQLRAAGKRIELVLAKKKLRRIFADAESSGARQLYLLGPDEVERGVARLRDLETGEETDVPLPE